MWCCRYLGHGPQVGETRVNRRKVMGESMSGLACRVYGPQKSISDYLGPYSKVLGAWGLERILMSQ